MFINYVIDLSTKIKRKDRGSYFFKNKKIPAIGKTKNFFRCFMSEILNFNMCIFSKSTYCFAEAFP